MNQGAKANLKFNVSEDSRKAILAGAQFKNKWEIECFDKEGNLKWSDTIENLVVNSGLDHALSVVLDGGTQITTWFIALTDGTPTVAASDTPASHAGWVEVTAYTEANRAGLTLGTVASQSIDNSGSVATFSIDTNSTVVGGAAIFDNNTKGGTTGLLYAAGAFAGGDKTVDNGDTLNVTVTFTASGS